MSKLKIAAGVLIALAWIYRESIELVVSVAFLLLCLTGVVCLLIK